ncbi:sarcosine oxidase subunit delta [Thiomicrorhabdus sp.]|uniref:sarcosine oxidase subunit delta n=1 Tax=Thiomicrorhabdus sp. TaxID=2039724 RepID=UPI003568962F
MKFVSCPHIGNRALSEFTYGGALRNEPDFETVSDKQWADYVFHRHSEPKTQQEWWYHRPTGMWFIFTRNTLTDVISQVELATEVCTKGALNEA